MNKTVNFQNPIFIFGIPFLIIGTMVLIAKSSIFKSNPDSLSIAITFDLLLTAPLVYFLLIRKTKIPKTTVVPFLILGLVVGSFILPTENQQYLILFKTWALPLIEIAVVSFVIYNIRKVAKQYRLNKTASFDFFTTLKSTCLELLPKATVSPIVTEIAVFYYGFVYWKKRPLKENEFSYHKESGSVALFIALICIIIIETVALHFLLLKWSSISAWILTFLSVYSGLQIFGFLKSMLKRPISIENGQLFLRYGIMTESTIQLKDIESIEVSSKDLEQTDHTRKLALLGDLESHNIILHLKKENILTGLYGIKKPYKTLAFYVDNKSQFKNQLEQAILAM